MKSLTFTPAYELAQLIREHLVSAVEVLEAHLAQIARYNPTLNAIVTLDEAGARRRAQQADAALVKGELWGPLHGVPFTLKDVHDTVGLRSTLGYTPLVDRVAAEDGVVAARLKAAGGVLLGKTNCEIFRDNPFGQTRNPWNLERTPGTSSGGAAAALAAGLTPLDIGSDISGSITVPSHYSGICGMRPTEQRLPLKRFPVDPVSLWRIMGVLGPMARSIPDLRLALRAILGPGRDAEVPPLPWQEVPRLALRGMRIAWAPTFPNMPIAPDIRTALEGLACKLDQLGAHVEQRLPAVDFMEQTQLSRYLFALMLGALETPSTSLRDYLTALDHRDVLISLWEQFFASWDVLLCPADLITAPGHADIGQPIMVDGELVDPSQVINPSALSPATGHPAVVIPLGRDREGLPIGVQVMGPRWSDERLLAMSELLAEVTGGYQPPPGYS